MIKLERQVFSYLLLLFVAMTTASCSDRTLSLFFDIPPPTDEELAAQVSTEDYVKAAVENALQAAQAANQTGITRTGVAGAQANAPEERKPPEIETAVTWEEAKNYFPMDREGRKGRADWTEAERRGIINPRTTAPGRDTAPHQIFSYDFFIAAPESDPGYEAYFPHSTHTEWIACESCHPKIFPVRGEVMTKKQIKKGKFCGVCHTKKKGTAFWIKACDRCHLLAKD